MQFRLGHLLVAVISMLVVASCGNGSSSDLSLGTDQPSLTSPEIIHELPGTPGLAGGARLAADPDTEVPLPRQAAIAGKDFAADRLVVIFETNPEAKSLTGYTGIAEPGGADAILPTDNAPLVQHPYFRQVSINLAQRYGLNLVSRVFYKNVNFAVYQADSIKDASDLDSLMLRVLNENPGLVREVVYDFFVFTQDMEPLVKMTDEQIQEVFRGNPAGFKHGGVNKTASIDPPDDPYYVNRSGSGNSETGQGQWGLWRMGATHDQAWTKTTGSMDVVVAVVDTGVRYTHEDLVDNCIEPAAEEPYNAPGILTDVINKDNDPWDGHRHGTFCAGQIGAKGNNGLGLAGVAWDVTLLPIKVLSDGGSGSDSQVAEGMLLADYLGANILSMSLGGLFPHRTTQLAAKQCLADGVLPVVAAGNQYNMGPHYPGYYPECMAVGATTLVNDTNREDWSLVDGELPIDTRFDAKTTFSCYGDWVDIAAPGRECLGPYFSSDTAYTFSWQGTSMATPHVAGCAALVWAYIDDPTADKVRGLLQSSATVMPHLNVASNPDGFFDDTSNGTVRCVNVNAALDLYDNGPSIAPTVTWNNPLDGTMVAGDVEIRLAVSGGDGNIIKVEFETYTRQIAAVDSIDDGYYRAIWDTAFEFNGPIEVVAKVFDDKGNMVVTSITVTANNAHIVPSWTETFAGVPNDSLAGGWSQFNGDTGTTTLWGATDALGNAEAPCMHSSGTTEDYALSSNDWLFAPIVDLGGFSQATLSFQRRFELSSGDYILLITTADDIDYDYRIWGGSGLREWTSVQFDLSQYAGKEVRIIWIMLANASAASVAGGYWIDDVSVTVITGTPPTISINSPSDGYVVSGLVPLNLTLSDDVVGLSLEAVPPLLPQLSFSEIPDNDPGPTKSFTIQWDSRHIFNGDGLVTVYAFDDEDGDGSLDDFVASDSVTLVVNNPYVNANWHESFESITVLGGLAGGNLDGHWYTSGSGASTWRIDNSHAFLGGKCAKMGPEGDGNYGNWESEQLLGPIHDLTSAAHPFLRIRHQLDVEDGTSDWAKLLVMRYDGLLEMETPIAEFRSDTGPAGTWIEQAFDLSEVSNAPLRLNFVFASNGDGEAGQGWLLDDYEILDANPAILSISNGSVGTNGSTQVITGTDFGHLQGSGYVSFAKAGGGITLAAVNSWSDTSISVVVPEDAKTGGVIVNVLGYDSDPYNFVVILPPPSIIWVEQLQ